LDVEDTEQQVLETFNFYEIPVRYLLVEVDNRFRNETKKKWLDNVFAVKEGFIKRAKIGASYLYESTKWMPKASIRRHRVSNI